MVRKLLMCPPHYYNVGYYLQNVHMNMSREISTFLMIYLQKKHNYETNIFSQMNPTSDTLCNAFYILGNIILNQMQVEL